VADANIKRPAVTTDTKTTNGNATMTNGQQQKQQEEVAEEDSYEFDPVCHNCSG